MEDADHVLHFVGIGVLAAQRLRAEYLALSHGIVPVKVVVLVGIGLLARRALLHGADAEAARQAVAAAALHGHGVLQRATPFQALFAVVGRGVVHGDVDLDHARVLLEAQLGGRRARGVVGAVGVLEDEEAAAEGEGRVEEDLVAGGDGVVVLVVFLFVVVVVGFGEGVLDNVHEVGVDGGHGCGGGIEIVFMIELE